MKRYALNISLALLFAAFMWSCQQQDPAPLSPEGSITLGKKGGKPPAATYTIEVFFDKNTDPAVEDFISVAKEEEAVTGSRGTAVSGKEIDLNLSLDFDFDETTDETTSFMEHFRDTGENVLNEPTNCFKHFFDEEGNPLLETPFVGELSVGERDGDPFDALAYFFTDDKVEPSLTIYMWGVIADADGWSLPGPGEELVVTGKTEDREGLSPGGPDKLGIRIEYGKKKSKEACLGGNENQPWRVVITRN